MYYNMSGTIPPGNEYMYSYNLASYTISQIIVVPSMKLILLLLLMFDS